MKKIGLFILLSLMLNQVYAQVIINVMVVATPTAITGLGGAQNAMIAIENDLQNLNASLTRSNVNVQVQNVYSNVFNYPQEGCMYRLLDQIVSTQGGDEVQWLHLMRNVYSADLVMIIVDEPTQCGISGRYGDVDESFMLVDYRCMGDNYSMAREFGYLMGCGNNPSQSGIFNIFNGTAQGYFYENEREASSFTTIMGYTDESLTAGESEFRLAPYWSTPDSTNVRYGGIPVGDSAFNNAGQITLAARSVEQYRIAFGNLRVRKTRMRSHFGFRIEAQYILDYDDGVIEREAEAQIRAKKMRFTNFRIQEGAEVEIRAMTEE